jgi:hypothetical protein
LSSQTGRIQRFNGAKTREDSTRGISSGRELTKTHTEIYFDFLESYAEFSVRGDFETQLRVEKIVKFAYGTPPDVNAFIARTGSYLSDEVRRSSAFR